MFRWADRLLDARKMSYGEWGSARNGTAGALDLLPKDLVLCDWDYELRVNYASVPFSIGKGFRVWPWGWGPLFAAQTFREIAPHQKSRLARPQPPQQGGQHSRVRIQTLPERPFLILGSRAVEPLADQ